MNIRQYRAPRALKLLIVAAAGFAGSQAILGSAQDATASGDYVSELNLGVRALQTRISSTLSELGSAADTVVVGTIEGATKGRTYLAPEDSPNSAPTYSLRVKVHEVLKGEAPAVVFIEKDRSRASNVQAVSDAIARRQDEAILFLSKEGIGWHLRSWVPVFDGDKPVPPGKPMYKPVGPQAMVLVRDGQVRQPEAGQSAQLYGSANTLEEAIEATRTAVADQEAPLPVPAIVELDPADYTGFEAPPISDEDFPPDLDIND